jgi:hypothetical protein
MTVEASAVTCPYCREAFDEESDAQSCVRCETSVHGECAALHRRCVVYGCKGRRFQSVKAPKKSPLALKYRPPVPLSHRLASALSGALDDASLLAVGLLGVTALVVQSLILG